MLSSFALALVALMPVPRSVAEVEAQLGQKDPAALAEGVANLGKACRGSLRLVLRDHAGVVARLDAIARDGSAELKRAVLASSRCARPAAFAATYRRLMDDADPTVAAYALEIVSNTQDASLAPAVLEHGEAVAAACIKERAPGPALEACVWSAYAASTLLGGATREVRERAAKLAEQQLHAQAPKVREVAVETLAATKLKAHAAALAALIERERGGGFATANDASLIKRFGERLMALEKGD